MHDDNINKIVDYRTYYYDIMKFLQHTNILNKFCIF